MDKQTLRIVNLQIYYIFILKHYLTLFNIFLKNKNIQTNYHIFGINNLKGFVDTVIFILVT